MPLIKYRTNGDSVNEIMVDSSITVSDFINLVNRQTDQRVSTSVFRGKVLNGDDLIRNHITRTDQVLTLLTDSSSTDIVDLEYESDERKKKIEVKSTVSSSILKRDDSTLQRRGFLYTFTVYTTATPNSMFHGHKMDFSLKTKYSTLKSEIKSLISSFPEVNYAFNIYIFLAGGVYFHTDSLLDYYYNPGEISHDNIYVVVEKKGDKLIQMSEDIPEPCNCSNSKYRKLLSPFCESSPAGLSQIAAFLGYAFHDGVKSERILLSLAKLTRFAPLVVNFLRLIEKRPLKALNILAITSPIFTLFRSMLPPAIKDANVFEYTLNFLSLFSLIQDNEYLKFFEIDTERESEQQDMNRFVKYCLDQQLQKDVIVWTADTVNPDFQASLMKPHFSIIENIFENNSTFKPVAPLSLHYIFNPTFVRGKEGKSVMLFIKEVPDKNKVVSIIDPLEGEEKEMNIEDLANEINCDTKDDVFTLIDPKQVDELLFICFDESQSMKWKLTGGNPHHNEKKRCEIASEFLESLVKQSYALRVFSIFGLISFSSEIKILQSLTPMSSEFIRSLKKIRPSGKTLLFDAINLAKEQICTFMRDQTGKIRFPNLRLRIIVITDGEDNKSSTLPENLVDELIRNEITVDTVLVSLEDRSPECCTISKLTGGLCFRPRNLEEGIRIFNQEAFLTLRSRHMNPLPYSTITKEIFDNETQNFVDNYASYAPNQMIINAQSKVSLATPMYMSYVSTKTKIKSYRIMRAFIELNIIGRNPNENYVVYSLHSTPEEWRIFIKGPAGTPFGGKWLNLYMTLPTKYPYDPPHFRFLTIPFHPNISAEGTVVFDLNNRNYSSSLGIDFIITKIIDLLKNPDPNYVINSEAMQLFTNNREEFNRRQEAENTGFNDYHQYLDGIKIYNEIPVNAVVPEEARSKSRVVSMTMDAIRKAALGGGQVQDACLLDINDYEIIRELGKGAFGVVYLVAHKLMHYEYAAKIPSNSDPNGNPIFDYIKEVNVISKLFNHGAIVKIYGYCLKDFDGNDSTVIIMENVPNGDMQNIIDSERNNEKVEGWDDTQKLINLYGIASGMAHSISYGIAHSDLKPANILMTNELYPKISDFDTAKLEEEGFTQSFNMSGNEVTSPLYTAPEIIAADEGYEQYAEKSDVYSFSIIAYEILTGQVPFPHYGIHRLFMSVVKGERPLIPPSTPERYKSLLMDTWNGDPAKRPTFQQLADLLKSDEFVQAEGIDRERLNKYFNYIEHYKTTITESKLIRPKTEADKRKSDPKHEGAVLSQSGNINIINLKNYNKQKLLGKGRFGQVYLILLKETNQVFAAKISNQRISIAVNHDIFKEINIMKMLNHPTILRFIGYSPADFDGEPKPTIITEYASEGSVFDVIQNRSKYPSLDDTKMFIIIYGIVAGMAYLHEHSILHNDLKPSNVLLDHNLHPKICDFGLSDIFSDSGDKSVNIKGTPSYIAPEIWDEQGCQPASDVYSFGILLYELVFSQRAFEGMKPVQIGYQVTNNVRPHFPSFFKMTSKQSAFKSLIQRCWDQDPKKRFTFKELLVELRNKKFLKNVDQKQFSDYLKIIRCE